MTTYIPSIYLTCTMCVFLMYYIEANRMNDGGSTLLLKRNCMHIRMRACMSEILHSIILTAYHILFGRLPIHISRTLLSTLFFKCTTLPYPTEIYCMHSLMSILVWKCEKIELPTYARLLFMHTYSYSYTYIHQNQRAPK